MQNDAKCVTILNHDGGRDKMIEHFEPDRQGKYRVPILTSSQKEYDNSLKLIESCKEELDPNTQPTYTCAVLDTGILLDHPVFKRYIKNYIDFTGEGITDLNGHGSMVTWQLLVTSGERPLFNRDIGLYICKILTADGVGTKENIIKGLKWAEEQNVRMINLSAGIDNRKWFGLSECKGTCDVCETAYHLKEKKIIIAAAAGNDGKTVCPAKVSFYYDDSYVISVGALQNESGEKEGWSGEGLMYAPGTTYFGEDISLA